MSETITLEQERLAHRARQGIGEAVAKVQTRGVPATASKIPVYVACNSCPNLGTRLDDELSFPDEIVKTAAGDRIAAAVDDDCGFEEIGCRDMPPRCGFDRRCVVRRLRLVAKDRDQRGRVDDHLGKPRSS